MNRVRYFSVLAELKHVRKAADVLKINPSSLSKAIKLLEHELGFKLLIPSGRGIEITNRGFQFYRQSQALLHEYAKLNTAIREKSVVSPPTVRIGSMEVFTTYFFSKLMETEVSVPKIRTRYLNPGKIEEALRTKEIDIGLTYIHLPEEELNYRRVGAFRMRIFGAKSMMGKKFSEMPFVVPIFGVQTPIISLRCLDGWPDDEFPRRIQYEFELLETALQVCRIGKAVVYCPDFVVTLHNQSVQNHFRLHEIPLPRGFRNKNLPIYLIRRKNDEEIALMGQLAKLAGTMR